jgi:hypothetical protein
MTSRSMISLRQHYHEIVDEPVPDYFGELLKRLPDRSDSISGAGGETESGLTGPGSINSALSAGSLSIHDADVQSHNLNAPLSTHWNHGGSVKC